MSIVHFLYNFFLLLSFNSMNRFFSLPFAFLFFHFYFFHCIYVCCILFCFFQFTMLYTFLFSISSTFYKFFYYYYLCFFLSYSFPLYSLINCVMWNVNWNVRAWVYLIDCCCCNCYFVLFSIQYKCNHWRRKKEEETIWLL